MTTLLSWADLAQRRYEEHLLACDACEKDRPIPVLCPLGCELDEERRLLFALSIATPRYG